MYCEFTQEALACNAPHCQVGLASGLHLVWTGDANLVVLVLAGQTNSATTLESDWIYPCQPLETGCSAGPWRNDAMARAGYT